MNKLNNRDHIISGFNRYENVTSPFVVSCFLFSTMDLTEDPWKLLDLIHILANRMASLTV